MQTHSLLKYGVNIKELLKAKYTYYSELLLHYKNGWYLVFCTIFRLPITQVTLKSGLVVKGNPSSYVLHIVTEIFIKKVYTPDFLPLTNDDKVIVDIGANIGVFSLFAAQYNPKRILAFEPFPQNIDMIKVNARINHIDGLQAVQHAVADKTGWVDLFLGSTDAGNLLFNNNIQGQLSESLKVKSITLSEIFHRYNLSQIDFLKIDCEGSEGLIFNSTLPTVWKKVKKIAMEYHDNVSPLSHARMSKKLKDMGFRVKVIREENSPFGYIYAKKN